MIQKAVSELVGVDHFQPNSERSYESSFYADALNRLAMGLLVLDKECRILTANSFALRILKLCNSAATSDVIIFPKTCGIAAFRSLIKRALTAHQLSQPFSEVIPVSMPDGQLISALVRSLSASGSTSEPPAVVVYLSSSSISTAKTLQPSIVARLLGLTMSEARVATLLAQGLSLSEAASQLQLTDNSARTYMKRILSKTGVNRQTELVQLILQSVAPLA
jgi:DNA-binding NarL/FixJ family response regulator